MLVWQGFHHHHHHALYSAASCSFGFLLGQTSGKDYKRQRLPYGTVAFSIYSHHYLQWMLHAPSSFLLTMSCCCSWYLAACIVFVIIFLYIGINHDNIMINWYVYVIMCPKDDPIIIVKELGSWPSLSKGMDLCRSSSSSSCRVLFDWFDSNRIESSESIEPKDSWLTQ